jgi:hypothetical protein
MTVNKEIKFARMAYSPSWNLGDHIQTLATEKFLGNNPISIERHELDKYDGERAIMLMQGYFFVNDYHCAFPPSENILPVFTGFHIENTDRTRNFYSSSKILEYIKKYAPIGCRDNSTKKFLLKNGIEAYLSRCLTLTFPTREKHIKGSRVFFIDEPKWMKTSRFLGKKFRNIYEDGVFLSQVADTEPAGVLSDEVKRKMAIERINLLKSEAKLVITSRLHVASPCAGMGIPVLLFPETLTLNRYETLKGIIPIYTFSSKYFKILGGFHRIITAIIRTLYIRLFINWNPTPPDIEDLKKNNIDNVHGAIEKAIEKYYK